MEMEIYVTRCHLLAILEVGCVPVLLNAHCYPEGIQQLYVGLLNGFSMSLMKLPSLVTLALSRTGKP